MRTTTDDRSGRRSFIKLVGSVLGAGAGLAVAGSASAAPSGTGGGSTPNAPCAIWCSPTTSWCESCGSGSWWFRCVSNCGGVSYACYQRSCAGFCLSQTAC